MKISSIPAWMLALTVLVLVGCTQPPTTPQPQPVTIEAETTNTENAELIDKVLEEVLEEADMEIEPESDMDEDIEVEIEILETAPEDNAQTFNYETPEVVAAEPATEVEPTYTEEETKAYESSSRRSRAS